MRKGEIIEGTIKELRFPNKGIFHAEGGNGVIWEVSVKNTLPGQHVSARIAKKRNGRIEADLLEVREPAPYEMPAPCPKFGICGGCQYLNISRQQELRIKETQIRKLLGAAMSENVQTGSAEAAECPEADAGYISESAAGEKFPASPAGNDDDLNWYEGILESPVTEGYRNKMELTFGDAQKDGPLTLGMHCRGSFYDVADAIDCCIADEDFRKIIRASRDYWASTGVSYYHRMRREGYLRHLIIRKGMKTGEILIDLVTTTQISCLVPSAQEPFSQAERRLLSAFARKLLDLTLDGAICGILHTHNDNIADIVEDQGTDILFGKPSFEEELLGLRFTVTPFSFFQTNSAGAELLYETARHYIADVMGRDAAPGAFKAPASSRSGRGTPQEDPRSAAAPCEEKRGPVIYDLYCGTGTISLLMAPAASKVIGVEIVGEAVEAARENAVRNGIANCEFIAGDVLKVIDEIEDGPDLIILDPPRDGVHPKALPRILRYGVPYILYISCKPTSLARDLPVMRKWGYEPVRGVSINQFVLTANCETLVLLSKAQPAEAGF